MLVDPIGDDVLGITQRVRNAVYHRDDTAAVEVDIDVIDRIEAIVEGSLKTRAAIAGPCPRARIAIVTLCTCCAVVAAVVRAARIYGALVAVIALIVRIAFNAVTCWGGPHDDLVFPL